MQRIYFQTFGCKANQYDTERMRQELEARGGAASEAWTDADVCVVNTCTVTNQADAEARRFIRRVRRENPAIQVVVAGCSAALRAEEYGRMDGVTGVVKGHDPVEVAQAVQPASLVQLGLRRSLDRIDHEPVGGELLRNRTAGTRGWLKVQDGCDRKMRLLRHPPRPGRVSLATRIRSRGRGSTARPGSPRVGDHRNPHRPLWARSRGALLAQSAGGPAA